MVSRKIVEKPYKNPDFKYPLSKAFDGEKAPYKDTKPYTR
jgi:hypothetical protein